ncbi:S-4TM family putative pore-forming effector [Hippea jasoniae]|uniref:S-4TM family putative pore-forming effector n=1 Tax=Hippea jasoniae TaxID=944479 RepID=UPI0012EC5286|nr:S-4TM family putative pore-forming effector [Hippea jasoniae]
MFINAYREENCERKLTGSIIIIEIFISAFINLSFREAMTTLFLSSIPIFVFIYEYYVELNKQIEDHKIVSNKILDVFNSLHKYTDSQLAVMIRQFQDYIYERNRLNSLLVSEILYKILREKYEETIKNANKLLTTNFQGNKNGNN